MLYNKHDDPKSKITHIRNMTLNFAKLTNVQAQTLDHQQPCSNLANQGSQLWRRHTLVHFICKGHVSACISLVQRERRGKSQSSNTVF